MKLWVAGLAVFFGIAGSEAVALADSWRCGNRLVSVGDTALEVRGRCGEPNARSARSQVTTFRDSAKRKRTIVSQIEEWSYRLDGNELMRTLIFEDGRLATIRVGNRAPIDLDRCARQLFSPNTPANEVLLACGEPDSRDRWYGIVEDATLLNDYVITQDDTYERWVYNFGPDRFLRVFEFVNDRLKKQNTAGRGL